MRFFYVLALFGVFLTRSIYAEGAVPPPTQPAPLRIAIILPLSGELQIIGESMKRGIDLALAELSPEQRSRLNVFFDDDQFDPKKTIAAYRKIQSGGKIDLVAVAGSAPALALEPIVEREHVVLVAIMASDPAIVQKRGFSFIHWIDPSIEARAILREIERRSLQRIGIVVIESPGMLAFVDALETQLRAKGEEGKIVAKYQVPQQDTAYNTIITQLRAKKVDATINILAPAAALAFATQARNAKLSAVQLSAEVFDDPELVANAQGALEGAWFVTASPGTEEFIQRFEKKTGKYPSYAAANSYDLIRMIAQSKAHNSEEIRQYFSTLKDFSGACGTYSATPNNLFSLQVVEKEIRGGKIITVP